jgi:hypothetical protein
MSCYRDTSTLMYAAVATADAVNAVAQVKPLAAAQALIRRSVALAIAATPCETPTLLRLARHNPQRHRRGKPTD